MKYVKDDIFNSNADAILHQVNCQGVMGSGIAKQIKEKYPAVFKYYKALCDGDKKTRKKLGFSKSSLLGWAQVCYKEDYLVGHVKDTQVIVNLFAQDRYGKDGRCYTDYSALNKCLEQVNKRFAGKSVAIPYLMGCGLAGGDWNIVSKLIEETLTDCDVILYEYCKEKEQVASVNKVIANATQTCEELNSENKGTSDKGVKENEKEFSDYLL